MNNLVEKREVWIDNKIFTKNDVLSLVRLFVKISNEIIDRAKEIKRNELIQKKLPANTIEEIIDDIGTISIEFTTSDNSTYTGSSDKILEEDEILSTKKIIDIFLQFYENVSDSKLVIKIKQSDLSKGYVSVESQDISWVNDTTRLAENFLAKCRNQSAFVKKFKIFGIAMTVLILNFLLLNIIELFIKTKIIFPKIMHSLFNKNLFIVFIVISLITVTPAISIYNWLQKLFPRIEIQSGKYFQQAEKEKRKKILMVISLILIPTIISFLLRLL